MEKINLKEIAKMSKQWHDMQGFVKAIARKLKVVTWAARNYTNLEGKILRFRVSARRHKGYIYLAVNGADLFDIYYTSLQGKIKKTEKDVYLEDVIDSIDKEIEFIKEYSV